MNANIALTVACLTFTAACATSPTGRKQLKLVPNAQMAAMGVDAYSEMKTKEPISKDPAAVSYVNCVAQAIIAANRKDLPGSWEINVFDKPDVNAFALPGGKIGVYMGMVDFADSPDQLAAVMGHEIAHIVADHGNERVSTALAAQGAMSALQLFKGGGEGRNLIMGALGLGFEYGVAKPHSRTQETEADRIGLNMLAKSGFNPAAAVQLWTKMAGQGASPPQILSTHPSPANRAKDLQSLQAKAMPLYQQAQASGLKPRCIKPGTGPAPAAATK